VKKNVENILDLIHKQTPEVDFAIFVNKKRLDRVGWESYVRTLNREANWNRLPDTAMIFSSKTILPMAFTDVPKEQSSGAFFQQLSCDPITVEGRTYQVHVEPFIDASGKSIGSMLIMHDISDLKATLSLNITLGSALGVLVLVTMLAILFVLLRRTDAGIVAQQS
jgi:hypothetical protein